MRRRHLAALALALAPALVGTRAAAQGQPPSASSGQDGGASPEEELRSLEAAIEQDEGRLTLAAGDCSTACSALASMRRAAERICALDPGPRCSAARGKVAAAADRVRGSCSDCAALRERTEPVPAPAASPPERESAATAEPGAGGCAGCATGGGRAEGLGALAIAALLAALRRRKKRRCPS